MKKCFDKNRYLPNGYFFKMKNIENIDTKLFFLQNLTKLV